MDRLGGLLGVLQVVPGTGNPVSGPSSEAGAAGDVHRTAGQGNGACHPTEEHATVSVLARADAGDEGIRGLLQRGHQATNGSGAALSHFYGLGWVLACDASCFRFNHHALVPILSGAR